MKEFETITELQIVRAAYYSVLAQWDRETERIRAHPDREMPIAKHRVAACDEQLVELHNRIIELGMQQDAESA